MSLTITPLSPALGAQISGVDISPVVAGLIILGLIKGIAPLIFGPLRAAIG